MQALGGSNSSSICTMGPLSFRPSPSSWTHFKMDHCSTWSPARRVNFDHVNPAAAWLDFNPSWSG
jgi:hypothetical protein